MRWVQSLGQDDFLEEETAAHSSVLAWEIPWTEELGGLQSMGSKESDMAEHTQDLTKTLFCCCCCCKFPETLLKLTI